MYDDLNYSASFPSTVGKRICYIITAKIKVFPPWAIIYFVKGYYSHAIAAPICFVSERDEKALTDVVALLFSYIVRDTTRHGIKAYT